MSKKNDQPKAAPAEIDMPAEASTWVENKDLHAHSPTGPVQSNQDEDEDQGQDEDVYESSTLEESSDEYTTDSNPIRLEVTTASNLGVDLNQVEDARMLEEHRLLEKQRVRDAEWMKEQDAQSPEAVEEKRAKKKVRAQKGKVTRRYRLIPIWLRILLILALCVIAVIAGAYVGYVILGHGDSGDVFKKETWQHIVDLVNEF